MSEELKSVAEFLGPNAGVYLEKKMKKISDGLSVVLGLDLTLRMKKEYERMSEEASKYGDVILHETFSKHVKGLNSAAYHIHKNAIEHGWYDEPRTFGDVIALCHSELSEALEAHRKRESDFYMETEKPEGVAVEMIDCVIRIFDYLASKNIDIERIITLKHEYNAGRPYRHGGKLL